MTLSGFVRRNAFRNLRRSVLTVVSIAFSMLLLTLMITVWRRFYIDQGTPQSAQRLLLRHRVSLANLLPSAYRQQIRAVPGVVAVAPMTWFGGLYMNDKPDNAFAQFATDPEAILQAYPENRLPEDQLKAWMHDRAGCMVDAKLAQKHGWKLGDRVLIQGNVFPVTLELTIRGIYTAAVPSDTLFFDERYLEESVNWFRGYSGFYAIMVDSPQNTARVAQAIDEKFHNSPYPTKTETEKAFTLDFIATLGNVKAFILGICSAVSFAILLVAATTMAMAVRERTREVAVLKALGFTRRLLLGLFVSESVALALLGGVLGALAGAGLVRLMADAPQMTGLFNGLRATWGTMAVAVLLAALVGFLSGVIPSYSAANTEIVNGLRHIG
ncbi:MAG TPA: FtsX-like permease family protein [Candidatus Eremiobacteraceae bacterium]|nr:FtsX-like permease family protein [Candidatus Eremiobacteraceae bacterium]